MVEITRDDVTDGIRDAAEYWFERHKHELGDIFQTVVQKAIEKWLDDHEDELLELIKDSV